MIEVLQKRFFIKRVTEILADSGCEFSYDVIDYKIYTKDGYDSTDLLYALFCHYDKIEDAKWKEDFCKKFGIPVEFLYFYNNSEIGKKEKYKFVLDKKPKVYISGPITGREEKDYKSDFNNTELYLTGLGYDVVNPVSYTVDPNWSWEEYMRRDIKLLMDCEYIYLIKGWERSRGARIEYNVAREVGIAVLCLDENGKVV